jgi:glycerol kinase
MVDDHFDHEFDRILSIDQGTTSSRVLVIDHNLKVIDSASREHT